MGAAGLRRLLPWGPWAAAAPHCSGPLPVHPWRLSLQRQRRTPGLAAGKAPRPFSLAGAVDRSNASTQIAHLPPSPAAAPLTPVHMPCEPIPRQPCCADGKVSAPTDRAVQQLTHRGVLHDIRHWLACCQRCQVRDRTARLHIITPAALPLSRSQAALTQPGSLRQAALGCVAGQARTRRSRGRLAFAAPAHTARPSALPRTPRQACGSQRASPPHSRLRGRRRPSARRHPPPLPALLGWRGPRSAATWLSCAWSPGCACCCASTRL